MNEFFWTSESRNGPFLAFKEFNEYRNKVKFLTNSPMRTTNKYGLPQFLFEVLTSENELKTFGISSKKLLTTLKEHYPITDKWFNIERKGAGLDTEYIVTVDNAKQEIDFMIDAPVAYADVPTEDKKTVETWIKKNIKDSTKPLDSLTSYDLKHYFENSDKGFYITNGQFKGAMLACNFYPVKRYEKNSRYKISKRSLVFGEK